MTSRAHCHFRKRQRSSLSPIIVSVSLLGVALLHAKEPPDPPPVDPNVANQRKDNRRASEPSLPVPWTEAELNPDVAKRPRFVVALGRARVNFGVFCGNSDPDLPGDRLSKDERTEFQYFLETVISEDSLPADWDSVTHSAYSSRGTGEPWIQVIDWETSLGRVMASRVREAKTFTVRLRVAPQSRLVIRTAPPPEDRFADPYNTRGEKFFDRAALHELLVGVFGFPFEDPNAYAIRGNLRVFEGVPVFFGTIAASAKANSGTTGVPPEKPKPAWYRKVRVLITDSDPQYVGVVIDFSAEARELRLKP